MSECFLTYYWHMCFFVNYVIQSQKKCDNNSCLCRAFGKSVPKAKNRQKNVKLTHATKFAVSSASLPNVIEFVFQFPSLPCVDNTCGFYMAHNLMLVMGQTKLDSPEVRQIYIYLLVVV